MLNKIALALLAAATLSIATPALAAEPQDDEVSLRQLPHDQEPSKFYPYRLPG